MFLKADLGSISHNGNKTSILDPLDYIAIQLSLCKHQINFVHMYNRSGCVFGTHYMFSEVFSVLMLFF